MNSQEVLPPSYTISTVVGGNDLGEGALATVSPLLLPWSITLSPKSGDMFILDAVASVIKKVL